MSTFTPTGSTGGAFVCTAGSYAIARSQVTTAAPTQQVSLSFSIARRSLWFRAGTTAGAQDIVNDTLFRPGDHVFSFVPTVSPYFIEFQLRDVGQATLSALARVAPGLLTLPSPWSEEDLPSARSEQSLDVQWWCDGAHVPRVLERRGANSWSLRLYQPADGPFEPNDTTGFTLTPSGRTGTVTIDASGPVFAAADAGSLIRLTQAGQYETANGLAISDATDSIRVSGSGVSRNFQYAISGTFSVTWVLERSVGTELSWVTVTSGTGTAAVSASLNDGLDGQIVYYRLRISAYTSGTAVLELTYSGGVTDGVARIFSVVADDEVTADVLEPLASTAATGEWARGSWSDRFGWPATVALFEGRLLMRRDDQRWQSAPENFESFPDGAIDNAGISGSVPGKMNVAVWDKACERLMIGNSGGEGFISSGNFDEVMVPGNARARIRTEEGSIDADAVLVSGAPAFIHRAGRKINQMLFTGDGYELLNLTRLHRDIAGAGQLVELAFQSEPEPRLFAVRSDGECAHMLLDLDERIGGWGRIAPCGTNAAIESVCVNPGTPEDHVYRSVRRTIDGETKRYVEKVALERWTSSSLAWRLECAKDYTGEATSTLDGLEHLIGEEVWVWGNGRRSGPYTVNADGEITLDYEVTYAIAGYRYWGRYKGPRLLPLIDHKKPDHLGMIVYNTMGGGIGWGRSFSSPRQGASLTREGWNYLPDRSPTGQYDAPVLIDNEDVRFPMEGSWDRNARVCIEFTGVGPSTLLALVPSIKINDR